MLTKKQFIAATTKTVLTGLLVTTIHPASADIVMNFGDNINPASSFPSTLNSTPFDPGTEFRYVDVYGNFAGGTPSQKTNLDGNEAWVFDEVTGHLKGVTNTDAVQGNSPDVNYYIDLGYNEPGTCRYGCPGLFKSDGLIYSLPFEFVAPLPGTPEGIENGPAVLSITSATTFEIHFPILEIHWAGARGLFGKYPDTGVTFFCSGQPEADFRCTMEHLGTAQEDVDSTGVFSSFTLQMELSSAASTVVALDVMGGTQQECNSHSGNAVNLNANVSNTTGINVSSINWLINGVAAGTGSSIQPTLGLGTHNVDVNVQTDDGNTTSASQTVTIEDTTPPTVEPAFLNPFTGVNVTEINTLFTFLQSNFNVSDTCDASPTTDGVMGASATDGSYFWVTGFNGGVRLDTDFLNLKVFATDLSGNISSNEVNLTINQ